MNLTQNMTKNIKSFLAYRIFFIILLFTTLPLFIYEIILYITEYSQKKEEVFKINTYLGDQIKKSISLDLKLMDQILDLSIDEINLKRRNFNDFLNQVTNKYNLHDLYFATIQKNNLVIQGSTKEQIVGKNINSIKNILNKKNVLFKTDQFECTDCIYFSKTIFRNQKPAGVLILSILQKDFFNFSNDELPDYLDISIINSYGKVIISTNKNINFLDVKNNKENLIIQDSIKDTPYILVLSVNNKFIQLMHFKSYFLKHGLVASIIFVFLMILTFFIVRILAKPTNALINSMRSIEEGNIETRYQKHKMGFEINYLGSIFNEMMDSIISKQKEIEIEKIEKFKYLQELKIAQEIQLSLLPDKELKIKDVDLAFGNIFAKEVGGDFYDFIERNGKVFFVIADISTKGILACLYALTLRSIIRSFATYFSSLEEIVRDTNKLFMKDAVKNNMFATAFFGLYDVNTKKLEYCNCGHLPAILRKKEGVLEFLTTKGKALGIEEFDEIPINHTTLKKDDLLFLYTDGIIDAINIENKFFGEKNLHEFIKKTHDMNSKEIVKNLFDKLKIYSKDTDQYDDATIVVLRII